ncbi:MAG: protein kinase, partial [Myxococcota bacterium]
KRLRDLLIEEVPEDEEKPPEKPRVDDAPAPLTTEDKLRAVAVQKGAPDPSYVLQLFETMKRDGRAARALELARQVLERHSLPVVAMGVAETLAERGDDEGAWALLQPLTVSRDQQLSALMLAAEIAERRGEAGEALALYEKVLARDLDFPRAKERADRLRERADPRRELAGATIATDGALARGRYRVERELGRGGAGTVFAAMDLRMHRRIALKVYHRRGRLERERLLVEARTPAHLEHPGVVRVFDVDPELGSIAMEWVRGGSVRRELGRGTISYTRALRWLQTALEAMDFVHQSGFVHHDIKPSNFLLREDDRVVLTDFGLAMAVGESPMVRAGGGEGTLQYMPPEQREGAPSHPSADVHAYGATLREVVDACDAPSDDWTELAAACTRKEPSDRPTVAALRAALSR